MRLATLLLRDAVVGLSQLEAALHSQVLYGGRLGSNLVELGFIGLDDLSRYLGQVADAPVATREMFEAVDPSVVAAFDRTLAVRYEAFPLGYLPGRPEMFAVALTDPPDREVLALLTRKLGRSIGPHIAPELRIYEYLAKHYGVTDKVRNSRAWLSQHAAAAPPGPNMHPAPAVGSQPWLQQPAATAESSAESSGLVDDLNPDTAGFQVSTGAWPGARLSYREVASALARAPSRDYIGDALIAFAAGRFDVAIVFSLRHGEAVGWRLYNAVGRVTPEALCLSLNRPSVLQAAFDAGVPYRGRSPAVAHTVERALWRALGIDREPVEMLVVPILVKQRVVNLLYVHGLDGEQLDSDDVHQLDDLAKRAAQSYIKLLSATRPGTKPGTC